MLYEEFLLQYTSKCCRNAFEYPFFDILDNLFNISYPRCLVLRPVSSQWVSAPKCTMMLISQFFDQPVFVLLAVIFLPPTCLNEIQWLNECSLYGQRCRGLLNDMDISVVWWFWMRSRGCLTSTQPATKRPVALMHEKRIKDLWQFVINCIVGMEERSSPWAAGEQNSPSFNQVHVDPIPCLPSKDVVGTFCSFDLLSWFFVELWRGLTLQRTWWTIFSIPWHRN